MMTSVVAGDLAALVAALRASLDGGPTVVPLPQNLVERAGYEALLASGAAEPDTAAVVMTSGSTGAPKGVCLSAAAIRAGAHATHARLGGPGSWHLCLPGHYVAGLMVISRAVVGGGNLLGAELADLQPQRGQRNYVSVVPTQLSRARGEPRIVDALSRCDAVLVGGAPMPAADLAWWRARVPIVTTYGMSETCGGCVYDGRPLDDITATLDDDSRVFLDGPVLFNGYYARPDLTAEALTGEHGFRTADRGHWVGDRLTIVGRMDDVVITGGVNVDLAEVERAAKDQFGVDLAVVGLPDDRWGTVVALATTADVGELATVRDTLRSSLAPAALPRAVRRGSLPLTSSGKIDRQAIIRNWDEGDVERS